MQIVDVTGQRFGRLVAEKRVPIAGRSYWECRCDCGSMHSVYIGALKSGRTNSCGCLRSEKGLKPYTDLTGRRFGKLIALRRDVQNKTPATPNPRIVWWCKCDCGGEVGVKTTNLVSGNTRSCGCLRRVIAPTRGLSRVLPSGVAASNGLFGSYKRSARTRGLSFDLSRSEFDVLVVGKCHYCDDVPSNSIPAKYGRNGGMQYNGIDRVDNAVGYTLSNVVTCCNLCNRAKGTLTSDQFLAWVRKVADGPRFQ